MCHFVVCVVEILRVPAQVPVDRAAPAHPGLRWRAEAYVTSGDRMQSLRGWQSDWPSLALRTRCNCQHE